MIDQLRLHPSSAERWTVCAGSAAAERDFPGQQTEAAKEGTCAAWVAEVVLHGDAHSCEDMLGETHGNGVSVDEDMVRHVQAYVDLVRSTAGNNLISVERVIELGAIRGRLDSSVANEDETILDIFDLKYGRTPIEAYQNKSLLIYAMGLASSKTQTINLHIFQPRGVHAGGPHRKWSLGVEELKQWYTWIMERARLALGPHGDGQGCTLTPGDHCLNCSAAGSCSALTATVYKYFEVITNSTVRPSTPGELSQDLSFLRNAQNLIKARINAVEAEVMARIEADGYVPGWGIEDKIGNRTWNTNGSRIKMMTGIDPSNDKLVTPAELERRGADPKTVEMLTYKPRIGRKLVPVSRQTFMQMFGQKPEEGS